MPLVRWFTALVAVFAVVAPLPAQFPAQPPPPAKYRATIRYHIAAPRDVHVALYDAMVEHLKRLEFEFDPPLDDRPRTDREDRGKNLMVGLIPARHAFKVLDNPSVATVLLVPAGFKHADDPKNLIQIRIELAGDLPTEMHRELSNQVRPMLGLLNFAEATGYDHRGHTRRPFTRMVGAIPSGKLDFLVKDLRNHPTDWLSKVLERDDFPLPLRKSTPIRVIEVLDDQAPTLELPRPPERGGPFLDKIAQDLWELLDKGNLDRAVRVQIFLIGAPAADDKELRFSLYNTAPSLAQDGMLGPVVSGSIELQHVRALAQHPQVSVIRLARPNLVQVDPKIQFLADNARALQQSGVAELHRQGSRGKGVRLALIDSDFRGWEKMVQAGQLNESTTFIDLTSERDPQIFPAPYADRATLGHGTQCALVAALAAPQAQLTLIRIDAYDPYQLFEIVRYIRGGTLSQSLQRRQEEVFAQRESLRLQREQLMQQRRLILENFVDETDQLSDFGFLGPVYGWVFSDRYWLYQQMAYMDMLEKAWADRYGRFLRLAAEVKTIAGVDVVSCPFVWQDGFANGSASGLSRWFTGQAPGRPLWFQSAGNSRGQSWTGLYRDADGNGTLDFAPFNEPLPKDRWTPELNFLGFAPFAGTGTPDLPAPMKLRLSFQWREPHDPDYFTRSAEDDPYRQPLAPIRLTLLRQRDPAAKQLPADAFEVIARSQGVPQRLEHQPSHSIFEQILEVNLPQAGRYAVKIERQLDREWTLALDPVLKKPRFVLNKDLVSTGVRPVGVATLPEIEKKWEMRARLFVDAVDEPTRLKGRPALLDFVTDQGSIGLPADARNVLSVGAMDLFGKAQPFSARGAPAFLDLSPKPDLLAYDSLRVAPVGEIRAFGTSLATPFAAARAACLLSSGMKAERVAERMCGK